MVSKLSFLLPILFCFINIRPVKSESLQPSDGNTGNSKRTVTRDGCTVVPLIPTGKLVSKTSLLKPVIWFYVEYSKIGTIPDLEVSHKDLNGKTISRILKLDSLNPTFVSYTLPFDNQELNENEDFRFNVQCGEGDGNSTGINIKRVSSSELKSLSIINFPLLRYATELYKLNFWAESSNLILSVSPNYLCKDKVNTINLFTEKVNNLLGESDEDKTIKNNMRSSFQKHFENVCK
ncbi:MULTISPECIES: hypothetical protein [Pseudanabaena]|uniref:hypothetical protein n=1 Tax=Pseudanabaena TaxID=1152 RepID=UPI00247994B7|nr:MULTISPECIES: hypothetical protein [Pseudanabaena]WGS71350.1 hypothetical protein OA858_16765 [Pseudanabaena galeata CCNP1313]